MDATDNRKSLTNPFSEVLPQNICQESAQNCNLHANRVFTKVCATVSDDVINTLPFDITSLLSSQKISVCVQMSEKENSICCVLQGDILEILAAEKCLAKHLNIEVSKDTCDKGILCELITADKPYSIALNRPRRRIATARLSSLNNNLATAPAVRIREKYNKAKRKCAKKLVLASSKRTTKKLINSRDELESNGKENVESNNNSNNNNNNNTSPQQLDLLEDCGVLEQPRMFSDGEDEQPDDEASEEDCSPKKLKKNYEELTPFKFFCDICSFKTKRESHFQKHLAIHSKVSTLYRCDKCPFTSIRLTHLRRHEMSHSQTTFACKQCSYKTDEEKLLARHIKLKHERAETSKSLPCTQPDLQCRQCPYKTTRQSRFQRHLRVHESGGGRNVVRVYQCDQCSYKTNRKEHYIRHVNNVHINKRPFLCDFCGKAFKRPDALKQHRVTHGTTETRETSFRCDVCQKGCRSQAHLNEHQAVHSNVRSFLCEMCGASFKTRSVQRKHMLTIHKNPRSYVCEHCDKRFNTNYALRRHLRLHVSGTEMTEDPEDHLEDGGLERKRELLVASDTGPSSNILNHLLTTSGPIPITIHQLTQMGTQQEDDGRVENGHQVVSGSSLGHQETTTLIPLQEALEQVTGDVVGPQVAQPFVASEATTALLYLTTNFTM